MNPAALGPSLLWRHHVGGPLRGSAALRGHEVVVASETGQVVGLNPDGSRRWSVRLAAGTLAGPAVVGGDVVVGAEDGAIYCLGEDGAGLWSFHTGGPVRGSAGIGPDGRIYVGSADGCLYALTSQGKEVWSFRAGGGISCRPAVDEDGAAYFGSRDGRVYAVRPDGTCGWAYRTGFQVLSSPALGFAEDVYVGSADDYFYCLDRTSGGLRWRFKGPGRMNGDPLVSADGHVYMGCADTCLYAFDRDGRVKWRHMVGGNAWPHPALGSNGVLYVSSATLPGVREGLASGDPRAVGRGALHAVSSQGTELWRLPLGGRSYPRPALGPAGEIYASCWDGHLYCVHPGG